MDREGHRAAVWLVLGGNAHHFAKECENHPGVALIQPADCVIVLKKSGFTKTIRVEPRERINQALVPFRIGEGTGVFLFPFLFPKHRKITVEKGEIQHENHTERWRNQRV